MMIAPYSALKLRLARTPVTYIVGKAPFIIATEAEALVWYRRQQAY